MTPATDLSNHSYPQEPPLLMLTCSRSKLLPLLEWASWYDDAQRPKLANDKVAQVEVPTPDPKVGQGNIRFREDAHTQRTTRRSSFLPELGSSEASNLSIALLYSSSVHTNQTAIKQQSTE